MDSGFIGGIIGSGITIIIGLLGSLLFLGRKFEQIDRIDEELKNQKKKIEYFDKKGELLKTAKFYGYRKIKGFYRAKKLHMINHQTSKESIIKWTKRRVKIRVSNATFDPDNLED